MSALRKLVVGFGLSSIGLVLLAPAAGAHPLGNFSINTSAGVRIDSDRIRVDYVVDSAEVPTVQAGAELDGDGDGNRSSAEEDRYATAACERTAALLRIEVDGVRVPLRVRGASVGFAEGKAGLETSRLECRLVATSSVDDGQRVEIDDGLAERHVGWHEIFVAGDGVTVSESDVASSSRSASLTSYPQDRLESPVDQRSASLTVEPGGLRLGSSAGPSGPVESVSAPRELSVVPGVERLTEAFTDLATSRDFTLGVVIAAVVVAIFLGSMHALAPGHGKTVMAAYLVGERGTPRQALVLCAAVTLSHTAGVLILGTVLTVSTVVASEKVYPMLGTLSGLIVAAVGVQLWRRTWAGRRRAPVGTGDHGHDHHDVVVVGAARTTHVHGGREMNEHHDQHDHHDHHDHEYPSHGHDHRRHGHHHPDFDPQLGWRSLVAMGLAGGMVPSPSALVVLLGAIALGRTWFGAFLVLAYGVGMSLSLVAAGLLLIRVRTRVDRFLSTRGGQRMSGVLVVAPIVTATFVVAGGIWISARAAWQL